METNRAAIWNSSTGKTEIHTVGCKALNKAAKGGKWVHVDADDLADLKDRGFPAPHICGCTK
jgi:hypothetical protein